MSYCIPINQEIRDLASSVGEDVQIVANLAGMWVEENPDERSGMYPSAGVLRGMIEHFKQQLNVEKLSLKDISGSIQPEVVSGVFDDAGIRQKASGSMNYMEKADREFSSEVRRDRAMLLSRLFSMILTREEEKKAEELRMMVEEELSLERKADLERQLSSLDRRQIIMSESPASLFMKVRDIFKWYIEDTVDNNIESEKEDLAQYGLSGTRLDQEARRVARYKRDQYKKILDNFKALAEEASVYLVTTEGVRIDLDSGTISQDTVTETDEDGNQIDTNSTDGLGREEKQYENWMINYTMVPSNMSLTKEVRKIIGTIPQVDNEGYAVTDDLGFEKYLDPNRVHASIIEALRYMTDSRDMIPLMEKLSKSQPWISSVIDMIKNDPVLESQFYTSYRKDFLPYYIQRSSRNADGSVSYKTVAINLPGASDTLMNRWKDNISAALKLSPDSIYTSSRTLSMENIKKGFKTLESLSGQFGKAEDKQAFMGEKKVAEDITNLLRSVGIDTNSDSVSSLLSDTGAFYRITRPLHNIFNILKDAKGKQENDILMKEFRGSYKKLAAEIGKVSENSIESSSNERGKTYYGHVQPSYIGTLFNKLKNEVGNDEKYEEFIQREFGQYKWFKNGDVWLCPWIEWLYKDKSIREGLQHKVLLHSDGVEYKDMTSPQYTITVINEYASDPSGEWAYYTVPVMSNAPIARFIRMPRFSESSFYKGEFRSFEYIIPDLMVNIVEQEIGRINLVNKRSELIKKGLIKPIENFDVTYNPDGSVKNIGGAEFKFIPYLNTVRYNGNSFLEKLVELSDSNISSMKFRNFVRDAVSESLNQGFERMVDRFNTLGLLNKVRPSRPGEVIDSIPYQYFPGIKTEEGLRRFLKEYYYNSAFATSQIIEITTTDLAFYKGMTDFQKRFKEINSPAQRLNTRALFNNEVVGREYERSIYVKDLHITSTAISDIEKVLDEKVKDHTITKLDKEAIISKYRTKDGKGGINVTDGQAFRSLSSYRAVMAMMGKWDNKKEQAYENIRSGRWDMEDFWTVWQTIKPFVYSQTSVKSGEGNNIKVPVQHKNSEFLIMAVHSMVAGETGSSPVLRAINRFMEENQIDVVQFDSAVKVGIQGAIDIPQGLEEDNVYDLLMKATGISEGEENTDVIHTIDYNDYGEQQENPEYFLDAQGLVGVQIRRLISADMSPEANIKVGDRTIPFTEWMNEYNALNVENVLQSYMATSEIFSDKAILSRILTEEARGGANYSNELVKSLKLNSNGEFRIPLYDESMSNKVQPLLNSIIKNRITRQKIKGGDCVQVSNYGLTDSLNIVFEGEGKDRHIKYIECYMPWYSRTLVDGMMKEGSHVLDINKIPDSMRKIIGYRIPTEDKYSMLPLYIKGFLPQQSGGAIMLPSDITTITGSDFDVDKMYLMIPAFSVREKLDRKAVKRDLKERYKSMKDYNNQMDIVLDEIVNGKIAFSEDSFEMQVYDHIMDNYDIYHTKYVDAVKYNDNLSPKENGTDARNNRIIELMWGILTNPETAFKMLNPQGFDKIKEAARVAVLLKTGISHESLRKELGNDLVSGLKNLSVGELDNMVEKYKIPYDPLSPLTQIEFHKNNMTGLGMVGIYANHNTHHAISQFTDVSLNPVNGAFPLLGHTLTSLHSQKALDGTYISRNVSGFLAASVDNAKDPVLEDLNQNTFTSDASMLLSRLGYSAFQVSLIMNQPIVREMADEYIRASRTGEGRMDVVNRISNDWIKSADIKNPSKLNISDITEEELIYNIMQSVLPADKRSASYVRKQAEFSKLFSKIMNTAEALGMLVRASRSDTQSGSAGPYIADTEIKLRNITLLREKIDSGKFPLDNADFLKDIPVLDEDSLRRDILNSKVPILQAFYTLGIFSTGNILSRYMPHHQDNFRQVVSSVESMTKTGRLNKKTLKTLYSDLFTYIMSKTEFFNEKYRKDFIMNFPNRFSDIVSSDPEIGNLGFIKALKTDKPFENSDLSVLGISGVGRLNTTMKENFSRDWANLLYMNNPSANRLALDLFRYGYFRGGFGFSPSSYMHLAPVVLIENIPGYIEAERGILGSEDDYSAFVTQFVRNHLSNKLLVPQTLEGNIKFTDNKGEFLNTVPLNTRDKITGDDMGMVKEIIRDKNKVRYIFMDFISKKNSSGDIAYYKLSGDGTSYDRIQPLGADGMFPEYSYGINGEVMSSTVSEIADLLDLNNSEYQEDMDDRNYNPLSQPEETYEEVLQTENNRSEIMRYEPVEVITSDNKKLC